MHIKRKEMIAIYLFTASVFLAGLWRFSHEEKLSTMENDSARICSYSILAESLTFYDDTVYCITSDKEFESVFLPVSAGVITSNFGYRSDPFGGSVLGDFHNGTDIAVSMGTEVYSILGGTVSVAEYDAIGGNYIMIEHSNGFKSYYGHLSEFRVSAGDAVSAGQIIGLSGESGKVTGPHLHFGLYFRNEPVDPEVYIDLEAYLKNSEK